MITVELYRQIRRLRTWIAFAALAALPTIAAAANHGHGGRGGDERSASVVFNFTNASGFNHALVALFFMSQFFLILVVASFAGESVAGEATWGTLRSLLARPVGRARLLASKLVVTLGLASAATLAVTVAGLLAGTAFFGWHPLARLLGSSMSPGDASWRLFLASLYVTWSMLGIVSFAFMLSTMTDRAGGAIAAAVGLGITSQILDGLRSLAWLHPWLPTHYLDAWIRLFFPAVPLPEISRGILIQLLYAGVLLGVAFWHFRRKDILS